LFYSAVHVSSFFNRPDFSSVELFGSQQFYDLSVYLAAFYLPRFPERIEQSVNVLACIPQFLCWNIAQRPRSVFGFVMAANVISAAVTFPKGQAVKV
jgi:hypothetical protein